MRLQDRMNSPDGVLSAARAVHVLSPSGSAGSPDLWKIPFRELLRRYRSRLKIPQRELASRLSVSQPTVARWETGECLPPRSKFLEIVPDCRAIGVGPLDCFLVRESLSLSPSEWERLRTEYEKECDKVYRDPRRSVIRSLSRKGLTYRVKPRTRPRAPEKPSTIRVHRARAVRILKENFVLDRKGNPVSDELFSKLLSSAREANSLFMLDRLTRSSGNLVYNGFKRKVLKAVLDLVDRYPRRSSGRPRGS